VLRTPSHASGVRNAAQDAFHLNCLPAKCSACSLERITAFQEAALFFAEKTRNGDTGCRWYSTSTKQRILSAVVV
jgi:hypothetical protein